MPENLSVMKNKTLKTKNKKTAQKNVKSPHVTMPKWLDAVWFIMITAILWMIGHTVYHDSILLASRIAYARIAFIAMKCWEHKKVITEIVLETSALTIRRVLKD